MKKNTRVPKSVLALLEKYNQGIKLDVGCRDRKQQGFVGMDTLSYPGVDIVHDIEVYPWPLPDNCASVVLASHVLNHINPAKRGFIRWMDEAWRVLKPQGQMIIAVAYGTSYPYCQDPESINPIVESSFYYFDPLNQSGLYRAYRPKPWKIVFSAANLNGVLEVILEKRIPDKSYG